VNGCFNKGTILKSTGYDTAKDELLILLEESKDLATGLLSTELGSKSLKTN
jgi:hypothetical protein